MKVLVENHKENDKIKAEAERKRQFELHTIRCNSCNAKLHFDSLSIHTKNNSSYIVCPCCRECIEVDPRLSKPRTWGDENKEGKIDLLEEGNFHMEVTCDNCESVLQFDYRDVNTEKIDDTEYYHYEERIRCPICNKSLRIPSKK